MNSKNLLAGILLSLISLGHLLRVIFAVDIVVGKTIIPMYISFIAFLLFGFAAYSVCYKKQL